MQPDTFLPKKWFGGFGGSTLDRLRMSVAFTVCNVLNSLITSFFTFIWPYRRETILGNLRSALGENSEVATYTMGYYRHLSSLLTSPLLLHSMRPENLHRIVRYEQLGKLNETFRSGRDAVLMASHFGNWEYLLSLPLFTPYQVVAVCARIKNPFVQQKMTRLRTRYGAILVYKEDFYRYV
jgi:Kdo2-lipid IVA lauroyltransferase/acyltransferase